MKTFVASFIFLLVGLAVGFYAGNWSYHKHIADEARPDFGREWGEF